MHKVRFNALTLDWTIELKTPLLVKAGRLSGNPSLPDMQFVRTEVAGLGETVYIPGSSLKGVFRSFSERVLRTINKEFACIPFGDESCVKKKGLKEEGPSIYKHSCRACKLFGNTSLKSRISFTDAYPEGQVKLEVRYGVALSRLTNAV
ncbi:MAG: RAMP superfamily CRISPR-associated protein, partial [Thermoproteota archaeon]